MKKSLLKITILAVLATGIIGIPTLSRAADTSTNMPAASDQTAPSKFYGPVTAVDTNAMTFTVGDQTFTVTSGSKLARDGKKATLSDVVLGEPARGTYVTGDDGKLNVSKVRFGKKTGGKSGGKKKTASSSDTNAAAPSAPPQQ